GDRPPRRRRSLFRRGLALLLRLLPMVVTLGLMVWALQDNPLARPLVAASDQQIRASLDRALAARLPPERLVLELDEALMTNDLDRIDMLLPLADRVGLTPDPAQAEAITALREAESGFWAGAADCARCAADVADCPSLRMLGACGIPLELTPVGDLNALRRAGIALWEEQDVDEVEVTLAAIGLAATGAIVLTGGSSATVKAGATALRLGRRMGTLTSGFAADLARLTDAAMLRRLLARSGDAADSARLARANALAGDVTRVVGNTSMSDGILLLRHVDSAEDAARLARLSDVAGPETRGVIEVLGKSRTFRALLRVSDEALAAVALIWLGLGQLVASVGLWLGGRLMRPLTQGLAGRL
ncbi:MAG TPA: hypothetical protein DEB47_22815, partial [Citreicella sp.]|nr:hypothetical protein [Citreicella sp.]